MSLFSATWAEGANQGRFVIDAPGLPPYPSTAVMIGNSKKFSFVVRAPGVVVEPFRELKAAQRRVTVLKFVYVVESKWWYYEVTYRSHAGPVITIRRDIANSRRWYVVDPAIALVIDAEFGMDSMFPQGWDGDLYAPGLDDESRRLTDERKTLIKQVLADFDRHFAVVNYLDWNHVQLLASIGLPMLDLVIDLRAPPGPLTRTLYDVYGVAGYLPEGSDIWVHGLVAYLGGAPSVQIIGAGSNAAARAFMWYIFTSKINGNQQTVAAAMKRPLLQDLDKITEKDLLGVGWTDFAAAVRAALPPDAAVLQRDTALGPAKAQDIVRLMNAVKGPKRAELLRQLNDLVRESLFHNAKETRGLNSELVALQGISTSFEFVLAGIVWMFQKADENAQEADKNAQERYARLIEEYQKKRDAARQEIKDILEMNTSQERAAIQELHMKRVDALRREVYSVMTVNPWSWYAASQEAAFIAESSSKLPGRRDDLVQPLTEPLVAHMMRLFLLTADVTPRVVDGTVYIDQLPLTLLSLMLRSIDQLNATDPDFAQRLYYTVNSAISGVPVGLSDAILDPAKNNTYRIDMLERLNAPNPSLPAQLTSLAPAIVRTARELSMPSDYWGRLDYKGAPILGVEAGPAYLGLMMASNDSRSYTARATVEGVYATLATRDSRLVLMLFFAALAERRTGGIRQGIRNVVSVVGILAGGHIVAYAASVKNAQVAIESTDRLRSWFFRKTTFSDVRGAITNAPWTLDNVAVGLMTSGAATTVLTAALSLTPAAPYVASIKGFLGVWAVVTMLVTPNSPISGPAGLEDLAGLGDAAVATALLLDQMDEWCTMVVSSESFIRRLRLDDKEYQAPGLVGDAQRPPVDSLVLVKRYVVAARSTWQLGVSLVCTPAQRQVLAGKLKLLVVKDEFVDPLTIFTLDLGHCEAPSDVIIAGRGAPYSSAKRNWFAAPMDGSEAGVHLTSVVEWIYRARLYSNLADDKELVIQEASDAWLLEWVFQSLLLPLEDRTAGALFPFLGLYKDVEQKETMAAVELMLRTIEDESEETERDLIRASGRAAG